jgi:hypothetical protein
MQNKKLNLESTFQGVNRNQFNYIYTLITRYWKKILSILIVFLLLLDLMFLPEFIITLTCSKNLKILEGGEAVQAYVKAPKGALDKPAKELKAFGKTRLLEPGESQTLTLTWHVMDMASYNEKSASWELDKGEYQWMAAASSADVRDTVVQKIAKSSKVKTLDVMKPQAAIPVNPMVKR